MVGGFEVDGGPEARLVNKNVNIKDGNMGREDGPGKSDRVVTIEALKEEEKGIMTMSSQQEDIYTYYKTKSSPASVCLSVCLFVCLR